MATYSWTTVFRPMNEAGSTGTIMTTIREGYNSIPTHRNEAGVGGANTKESIPNNSTFIRFQDLNSILPKGTKITNATLAWRLNHADFSTSVTHKYIGCQNFNSTLTGTRQPKTLGVISQHTMPYQPLTISYPFSVNVTNTVQSMVDNDLFCMKVFTSAGKNRKYLNASCTLNVEYQAHTGKPTIAIQSTDCTSFAYAGESVTVAAGRPIGLGNESIYYRYTISTSGSSHQSPWTTSSTYALPILGSSGSVNSIKVASSMYVNGSLATESSSITITKNLDPVIFLTGVSSPNIFINNNSIVANGQVTFKVQVADLSIKKNFNAVTKVFVNNINTNSFSIGNNNFVLNCENGKSYTVYAETNDGFKTVRSATFLVKGNLPIQLSLSGDLVSESQMPCDITTSVSATAVVRDIGTTVNSLVINVYKIENGITSLYATKTGYSGAQSLPLTIPSYGINSGEVKFFVAATAKSTIGQETTISSEATPVIINRKMTNILNVQLKRDKADFLGATTEEQDMSNGYNLFYVPSQEYVNMSWNNVINPNSGNKTQYQITTTGLNTYISTNSYAYLSPVFAANANRILSVRAVDDYNSTNTLTKTLYGANKITITPTVVLKCFENYTGSGTPVTINENQLVDVTSTYIPNKQLTNILQFNVPNSSTNSTLSKHMRFVVEIHIVKNGTWKLIQKHTSTAGSTSMLVQHGLTHDSGSFIGFRIYYIDRFDKHDSGHILSESGYTLRTSIYAPQVRGCFGGGYRWVFGELSSSDNNLKTPTFFCKVINPNSATYTITAELYSENKTLLETVSTGMKPNQNVIPRISIEIPGESVKAWRFTTNLVLENNYYIILKIYGADSFLIASSAFNKNSIYTYSQSYNGKKYNEFWSVGKIITSEHINTINSYIRDLYKSYGFTNPLLFEMQSRDIIYATNDLKEILFVPELRDPGVVEPSGDNLCPNFYQWDMTNKTLINNGNEVTINETNKILTSYLIPWKHRANTMKLSFVAKVGITDYDKLFKLDVEYYDYYKNLITNSTHSLMLITPSSTEITYANQVELTYENIYNTSNSNFLSTQVYYIRLKLSRYEHVDGISSVIINNVLLTSSTASNYTPYTSEGFLPIAYSYGSKQTALRQCRTELLRFITLLQSEVANTGISFATVPNVIAPTYIKDSKIMASSDISNLSTIQGMFNYLKVF